VSYVYRFAIHQGTTTHDAAEAPRIGLTDRFIRDAALTKRTVNPDAFNARVRTLSNDLDRYGGMRHDDHPVNRAGDRTQVFVAGKSLNLLCVGIQSGDVIARVAELAKDSVSGLISRAGHSGNHEPPSTQKLTYGFRQALHRGFSGTHTVQTKSKKF
jgi:hypothetical protein